MWEINSVSIYEEDLANGILIFDELGLVVAEELGSVAHVEKVNAAVLFGIDEHVGVLVEEDVAYFDEFCFNPDSPDYVLKIFIKLYEVLSQQAKTTGPNFKIDDIWKRVRFKI